MYIFRRTFVLVPILILPLLIFAADSISGKWRGTSQGADNSLDFILDLKQDGENVTGTFEVNSTTVEVSGTFRNGQLEFVIDVGDAKYTATASIKDNKLEGKWKNDRGEEGTWNAEKDDEKK